MPATKSSKPSRTSKKPAAQRASSSGGASWLTTIAVFLVLAVLAAGAASWFYAKGYVCYYGDAEAHLNIARRIVDSRTPGRDQIGTVWLPLPHLLMVPFAANQKLWETGLAGTIPGVLCFLAAGMFLFCATRRLFGSTVAAACSLALFALNPNLLYLQSAPMTEPVFFASVLGLLYFTVLFRDKQSILAVLAAGAFSNFASLTRYEGWSLIPFVALYFLIASKEHRWRDAFVFGAVASLTPLAWLAHNWWYFGDALEFYRGPYSAKGIYQSYLDKGMAKYPGDHDWGKAVFYYEEAVKLAVGLGLFGVGVVGAAAALARRIVWPVLLLFLAPAFYVLSMYSSGTPIFLPHLWPQSYYNTRYGLAALPFLALGGGALVAWLPFRFRGFGAALLVVVSVAQWIAYPREDNWITWKESQVNSVARREWTAEAAAYMKQHYKPGQGIFTSFGDLIGIYRQAGIPLKDVLHDGNNPEWMAAYNRPDLFLWTEWAVTQAGGPVSTAIQKAQKNGPYFRCVKIVAVKGAPVIEIYRRDRRLASPR